MTKHIGRQRQRHLSVVTNAAGQQVQVESLSATDRKQRLAVRVMDAKRLQRRNARQERRSERTLWPAYNFGWDAA